MRELLKGRTGEILFILVIVGVASFLLLANLGNRYLWQDEAETALVARTILTHGVPLGYDGKNSFSQDSGAEYGPDYVWRRHPWLQYYLVAGSFKLLGTTALTARLPFALLGLATFVVFYFFTKELTGSRTLAVLATVLLLISVPFLILMRQCRYYSAATLLLLCALYAYLKVLKGHLWASVAFVVSVFLLFNANYLYVPAVLGATVVHAFFWHRQRFLRVLMLGGIAVLVNIPGLIWFAGLKYYGRSGIQGVSLGHVLFNLKGFVAYAPFVFPLVLVALVPACIVASLIMWKRVWPVEDVSWKGVGLAVLCIGITLPILSLFSTYAFFRYLGPLIPLFCIVAALIIKPVMKLHWVAAIVLLALIGFLSPLGDFLYEITHDYQGPAEGIVTFLKEHAKPDDVVAITYGDMPVKFYTDLRVIGAFSGDPVSELDRARWVIFRKFHASNSEIQMKERLVRMIERVGRDRFEPVVIDVPDVPFENSEDPRYHRFRTEWGQDRVVILRKIR